MGANLEAKKILVEEIKDKVKKSHSVAIVDFSKVTVAEDTKLRKDFRKVGADYKVYKNRLMLLALKELGIKCDESKFQGLSAMAFSFKDEVSAPKVIKDNAKEINKLEIKFGIIDGKIVDKSEIETLASIPPKEILIAMLLGTLNAPIAALARGLNAIATK